MSQMESDIFADQAEMHTYGRAKPKQAKRSSVIKKGAYVHVLVDPAMEGPKNARAMYREGCGEEINGLPVMEIIYVATVEQIIQVSGVEGCNSSPVYVDKKVRYNQYVLKTPEFLESKNAGDLLTVTSEFLVKPCLKSKELTRKATCAKKCKKGKVRDVDGKCKNPSDELQARVDEPMFLRRR